MLPSVLYGILTGLICVGGITLSLKAFFKLASDDNLDPMQRKKLMAQGIVAFVGQFMIAIGAVLLISKFSLRQGPFVFGLLSMNFIIPLLIHFFAQKNDKDK